MAAFSIVNVTAKIVFFSRSVREFFNNFIEFLKLIKDFTSKISLVIIF